MVEFHAPFSAIQEHFMERTYTVSQISDTHLFADDTSCLFGYPNNQHFYQLLDKIRQQPIPDAFFLSGDLSQDHSRQSYQILRQAFESFAVPVYWIPGNHDELGVMSEVFNASLWFRRCDYLSSAHWDFVFLDSQWPGHHEGYLSQPALHTLSEALQKNRHTHRPLAIVMHHHPVTVHNAHMDRYLLQNPEPFWALLNQYPAVQLILCGHVHGDYQLKHQRVTLETCPASCFQIKKDDQQLQFDAIIGYKRFVFTVNGYTTQAFYWPAQKGVS